VTKSSPQETQLDTFQVTDLQTGERLDKVLATFYPELSRSRLQEWIKSGQVKVNGELQRKPKTSMLVGDQIQVEPQFEQQGDWQATPMALDIVYEDEHILIINKPAGLVVHPAPGHENDTLVNGLIHYRAEQNLLPRAGIVHRLDQDTSGLLVVAKTPEAHAALVEQLQRREFAREYLALVHGILVAGDSIDLPIGRHPHNRKKMAVVSHGKEAVTHFRIEEKFADFTLLRVKLETGRTHQIRVHMAYLKHPLVGDPLYGNKNRKPKGMSEDFASVFDAFKRQALHAERLGLSHPVSGEWMQWQTPLPQDFTQLLSAVREFDQSKRND